MFYVGKEFDVQKNKEYKTLDGAKKSAGKANLYVFDEVGTKLYPLNVKLTDNIPEGAMEDNQDGTVNVYNEDGEKVGTVTAEEAEAAAKAAEHEKQEEETKDSIEEVSGVIRRVFQGKLRLRRKPSMDSDIVCGVTMFEKKRAVRKHTVNGAILYETSDGYFISGDPAHVEFIPDRA